MRLACGILNIITDCCDKYHHMPPVVEMNKILLFLFILRLCFKTENLFDAQFGEFDKCI